MSKSVFRLLTGAALAAAALLPAAVRAQSAAPAGIPRRQVLSIQPLGIPALFFSGEYERALDSNVTLGAGASYFSPDELTMVGGDVKARFYPGTALRGFSVGMTAGYLSVSESYDDSCDPTFGGCTDDSVSGLTLGVQLDYQWLLGRQDKYAFALGAGMKRFLAEADDIDNSDFTVFYPTLRASFGIAF